MKRTTDLMRARKEDMAYLKKLHLNDNQSTSVLDKLHKILNQHKEQPFPKRVGRGFVTTYRD